MLTGWDSGGAGGGAGGGSDGIVRRRTVSHGTLLHARSMPLSGTGGGSSGRQVAGRVPASGMGAEGGEDGAGSRVSPGLKMRHVPSYRRIGSSERLAAVAASIGAAAPATAAATPVLNAAAEGVAAALDASGTAATAAGGSTFAAAAAAAAPGSTSESPPSPAPSLSTISGSSSSAVAGSARKARGRRLQLDVRRLISKVSSGGSGGGGVGGGAGGSAGGGGAGGGGGVVGSFRGRLASLAASTGRLRRAAADYVHDNIPALPAIIDTVRVRLVCETVGLAP